MICQSTQAATDTWSGSSSVNFSALNGFNAVPANGDTLVFGADGTAGTTASHVLNNDLSGLTLAAAASAISFSASAPAYTINGNAITLGTGAANSSGSIVNSSTNLQTFGAAINYNFASSFVLTLTPGTGGLAFTGGLNNTSTGNNTISVGTGAVTIGNFGLGSGGTGVIVNGAGNVTINGAISQTSGTPGLQFQGTGTFTMNGTNTNTGTNNYNTTTGGGTTVITGNESGQTGATVVGFSTGALSTLTVNGASGKLGGTLSGINATINVDNSANLLASRLSGKALTLSNSTLNYTSNNGATASTETVAALTINSGASAINLAANATSGTTLTSTSIVRGSGANGGGTLLITGNNLGAVVGASNTNVILTAHGTNAAASGSGTSGSTINILGFALGRDTALSGNAQYGFVTDQGSLATTGVRLLTSGEYITSIPDGNTTLDNANLASANVLTTATKVNSVRLDTGGSISGSTTLTVGDTTAGHQGAILSLSGNSGISVGTLAFGSGEAVFRTVADLAVSSVITGTGGLTKSDAGTLTFSGANTYTGTTSINQGLVKIGIAQVAGVSGALGASPVVTLGNVAGTALDLNGFDTALGSLGGGGAVGGNVVLGANTLTLGLNNATGATFSGVFTGSGGLTKIGTGTQTFNGTNVFTNGNTINIIQGQITVSTSTFGNAVINLGDTTFGNSNSASFAVQTPNSNIINVRAGSSGTLTILSGNNQALSGLITLGTGTTAQNVTWLSNAGGVAVLNSQVTGYGNFTINNNQNSSALASTVNNGTTFNNIGTVSNISSVSSIPIVTVNGLLQTNVTGLIQNSVQTLKLGGANTFRGDTTLTSGTLLLSNSLALQNSVLKLNNVAGSTTFDTAITAATIGGLDGNGNLTLVNTNATPAAVNLTIGNSNGNLGYNTVTPTYSGVIGQGTNAASVTKVGTNTQILTGANTYTGATAVGGGTLQIGNGTTGSLNGTTGTALSFNGPGTINFNEAAGSAQNMTTLGFASGDGTVQSTYGGSGSTVLTFTTPTRTAGATGNYVISGGINGSTNQINLTKAAGFIDQGTFFGGADYAVMNGTNTYVRALAYDGVEGSLVNTTGAALTASAHNLVTTTSISGQGAVAVNTIKFNGTGAVDLGLTGALTLTNGGLLRTGGGSTTISGGSITTGSGTEYVFRTDSSADSLTVNSAIGASGTNILTKSGAGTLVLGGTNTYTGATFVDGGILSISSNANLGAVATGAALNLNGGTLQVTGATVTLDNAGSNKRNVVLGIGGGTIDTQSNAVTVSGVISGTNGALTKTGTGTLTLSGTNTYTGPTTLSAGTLSVATINNGGTAGNLGQATNSVVNLVFNGGTLQYTGANASTDRSFTINTGKTATIDVTANTLTMSGASTFTNGSLTKTGAGTLALSGANLFTGATTVSAGTLALGNVNALQKSPLDLSGAGTVSFTVGGTNTYNLGGLQGTGTLTAGANSIALGLSSISTVTIPNGTSFISSPAIAVTTSGTFVFAGTLNVNFSASLAAGSYSFNLFDGNTGGSFDTVSVAGSYAATLTAGNSYTMTDGSGNIYNFDNSTGVLGLTVASIPEPATYAAIFGALALGGAFLRRRRLPKKSV